MQTGEFARGLDERRGDLMLRLLEQLREAAVRPQRDQVKVNQVYLRKEQRAQRLLGGFHADTFQDQHHARFVQTGVELPANALLVEGPHHADFG